MFFTFFLKIGKFSAPDRGIGDIPEFFAQVHRLYCSVGIGSRCKVGHQRAQNASWPFSTRWQKGHACWQFQGFFLQGWRKIWYSRIMAHVWQRSIFDSTFLCCLKPSQIPGRELPWRKTVPQNANPNDKNCLHTDLGKSAKLFLFLRAK